MRRLASVSISSDRARPAIGGQGDHTIKDVAASRRALIIAAVMLATGAPAWTQQDGACRRAAGRRQGASIHLPILRALARRSGRVRRGHNLCVRSPSSPSSARRSPAFPIDRRPSTVSRSLEGGGAHEATSESFGFGARDRHGERPRRGDRSVLPDLRQQRHRRDPLRSRPRGGAGPGTLDGSAEILILAERWLEEFSLDLAGLDVSSVTVNDVLADFEQANDKLIVMPREPIPRGSTFRLSVAYAGTPDPIPDRRRPARASSSAGSPTATRPTW